MEAFEAAERTAEHDIVIGASRIISRPRAEVYAFLSDLRKHWPLLGGDLVDAGIVDGTDENSAELILRGPVPGIERRVITRVTYSEPDSAFGGEATAGDTVASIDWRLSDTDDGGARVGFNVGINPGGLRDRLLVNAAKPWLQRRCGQVLARLERELDAEHGE